MHPLNKETLTNVFWGLFLIWFGLVAVKLGGDLGRTIEDPLFALGTGVLLLVLNLVRSTMRMRVSILTVGLGALLAIIYTPVVLFGFAIPFIPALLIILGVALVVGAIRTRNLL